MKSESKSRFCGEWVGKKQKKKKMSQFVWKLNTCIAGYHMNNWVIVLILKFITGIVLTILQA